MLSECNRAAVLAWVNDIRDDQGRPALAALPRGTRGDMRRCPIAKATGLFIDGTYARSDVADVRMPRDARAFALAFDAGNLPQFDARNVREAAHARA
jgi:hypothetical protein